MESGQTQPPGDFIPTDIVDALSKVQNIHLVESRTGPLAKEFFDLQHVRAFSSVGLKSALHDSVIWAIGYLLLGGVAYFVQENYLTVHTMKIFRWTVHVSPYFWFTKIASFGFLATSTGCCIYMSQYYIDFVCKRAINTLFMSRSLFLTIFSFVTFGTFGLLYKYVFNDTNVVYVCHLIYRLHPDTAERLYGFFAGYFRRSLFQAGIVSLVASFVAVLLPMLCLLYFRYRKKKKKVRGIRWK